MHNHTTVCMSKANTNSTRMYVRKEERKKNDKKILSESLWITGRNPGPKTGDLRINKVNLNELKRKSSDVQKLIRLDPRSPPKAILQQFARSEQLPLFSPILIFSSPSPGPTQTEPTLPKWVRTKLRRTPVIRMSFRLTGFPTRWGRASCVFLFLS